MELSFSPHYYHRQSQFEIHSLQEQAVVFLGDSITEQCEWAEFFPERTILNRGISGDRTDGILKRIHSILSLNPHKLFLMIGINDLGHKVPPNVILDNYRTLIELLIERLPQTKLFVQSILPVNEEMIEDERKNRDVELINRGIQTICSASGIPFINLYKYFINNAGQLDTGCTHDGLHINGKAYQKWYSIIKEYVEG